MKGHVPRKRFGQNFLADPHYIGRIVEAIAPQPSDNIVEIGPGLAALTEALIARAGHVSAIEIDRDLAARLRDRFAPGALTLHEADALAFDFATLGADLRVVGNLPYNISTPLLFHLAQYDAQVRDITVMLQKEVVARMAAAPGSADYGRLSVMLQVKFAVTRLFVVPPGAQGGLCDRAAGALARAQACAARRGAVRAYRRGGVRAAAQDVAQRVVRAGRCRRPGGGGRRSCGTRRDAGGGRLRAPREHARGASRVARPR